MAISLTEVCQYLRNWFDRTHMLGDFTAIGGVLGDKDGVPIEMLDGQYYRVIGSVLNDGVHKFGDEDDALTDERWGGAVWTMAIPPDFLQLVSEISAWVEANAGAIASPYASESFGGYSYSLRTGGSSTDGTTTGASWQSQFASRLAPWRKI